MSEKPLLPSIPNSVWEKAVLEATKGKYKLPPLDLKADEYMDTINKAIEEVRLAEAEAIERACEAALQGGQYGVLEIRDRFGLLMSVAVHPSVPYGQRYILPTTAK